MRYLQFVMLLLVSVGCSRSSSPSAAVITTDPPLTRDDTLKTGGAYLSKQQSEDGAWRSDVYATFKDGTALTPLVLTALQDAASPDTQQARRKASAWLAKFAKDDGTIDEGSDGFPYPVYTAALSVIALSHEENTDFRKQRDAWLKYLLARQLTPQNGWQSGDKHYGGWGYYPKIPKKPKPGEIVPAQQLLESNLSATTFALDALFAAQHYDADVNGATYQFLIRRTNEDGGFHFIADDPVRNKAGGVGNWPSGEKRFNSYGSATADGARVDRLHWLTARKLNPDGNVSLKGEGVGEKAVAWLKKHFTPDTHPGEYIPTHERNRNAVYFYYTRSVAKTFRLLGVMDVQGRHWAESLSEALLAKQKPDGSWENPADQQRENDPILATAYAVSALAECRNALAAK